MSSSKRLLRNLGYAALIVLWLVVMTLPCAAFALAARGELEWRRGLESDRIWLIQERDEKGIGYHSQRLLSGNADGPVCVRNSVRFFLWEGSAEGENTDYCECTDSSGFTSTTNCP
jgi:hypothetical protein